MCGPPCPGFGRQVLSPVQVDFCVLWTCLCLFFSLFFFCEHSFRFFLKCIFADCSVLRKRATLLNPDSERRRQVFGSLAAPCCCGRCLPHTGSAGGELRSAPGAKFKCDDGAAERMPFLWALLGLLEMETR